MAAKKLARRSSRKGPEKPRVLSMLARYEAEAKEINAAKQAMQRINRGVEFQPARLHYVTDLHLL
jgi:hypothetical protein